MFEQEPTAPDTPLLKMPSVVATPRWAGGTAEGSEGAFSFAVTDCVKLAERRPLPVVLPEE